MSDGLFILLGLGTVLAGIAILSIMAQGWRR